MLGQGPRAPSLPLPWLRCSRRTRPGCAGSGRLASPCPCPGPCPCPPWRLRPPPHAFPAHPAHCPRQKALRAARAQKRCPADAPQHRRARARFCLSPSPRTLHALAACDPKVQGLGFALRIPPHERYLVRGAERQVLGKGSQWQPHGICMHHTQPPASAPLFLAKRSRLEIIPRADNVAAGGAPLCRCWTRRRKKKRKRK